MTKSLTTWQSCNNVSQHVFKTDGAFILLLEMYFLWLESVNSENNSQLFDYCAPGQNVTYIIFILVFFMESKRIYESRWHKIGLFLFLQYVLTPNRYRLFLT